MPMSAVATAIAIESLLSEQSGAARSLIPSPAPYSFPWPSFFVVALFDLERSDPRSAMRRTNEF